jgi:hypothetical protein
VKLYKYLAALVILLFSAHAYAQEEHSELVVFAGPNIYNGTAGLGSFFKKVDKSKLPARWGMQGSLGIGKFSGKGVQISYGGVVGYGKYWGQKKDSLFPAGQSIACNTYFHSFTAEAFVALWFSKITIGCSLGLDNVTAFRDFADHAQWNTQSNTTYFSFSPYIGLALLQHTRYHLQLGFNYYQAGPFRFYRAQILLPVWGKLKGEKGRFVFE